MILNKADIQKRMAEKLQKMPKYEIADGLHIGEIKKVEYDEESDRLYITTELAGKEEGTTFKYSADLADFAEEPLSKIIEPFMDDEGNFDSEEITEYDSTFSTLKNKSRKTGKMYSNITEWDYTAN